MERRDLIKATGLAVAATALGPIAQAQGGAQTSMSVPAQEGAHAQVETYQGASSKPTGPVTSKLSPHPEMKYRQLGRTGEHLSLVGMGGFHLAKPGGPNAEEAIGLVHAAIDGGITFFDNCWDYNDGESEKRLGAALAGGYRDRVFLMTKIDGRTSKAAMAQLDESLQRLKTDHLDLLQFHEIIRMDDPDHVFASGGALEAVLRAREQGKLRYIGFTGHKSPAIHKHMFEVADQHGFHFDSVQMPLNVMDAHFDSFELGVLPLAVSNGTGVLGMKAFGDDFILKSKVATPMEMLQYPMGLPITLQVTGIDNINVLRQALQAVQTFEPPTQEQRRALLARTASVAADGKTERYKTSHHFDGTVQNPKWLG